MKAIGEAWLLLTGCALLMFGFHWLFVYITSLIGQQDFRAILDLIPPVFRNLASIPVDDLATYPGRVSMAYLDPVVYFASACWAIGRGSDCISGEIGRGTMEMLLAQPVRRGSVLFTQAVVMTVGAGVLAVAAWLGTFTGLRLVKLDAPVDVMLYVPAAANLFALTFFTAGLATLTSSWDRYRWRTIGLMTTFYLVEFILKVVSRMVPKLDWLANWTFHGAYLPQILVNKPDEAWQLSWQLNGTLIGMGLAAFALAAVIFCRRDLPAPL
jgi:ABC-2 type transport system permease protein